MEEKEDLRPKVDALKVDVLSEGVPLLVFGRVGVLLPRSLDNSPPVLVETMVRCISFALVCAIWEWAFGGRDRLST